ncbi:50S ribosomal protein L24 [Paremcibacter congregatus]|uniref:Large ribosomal subunit protein uL24 n=1 Tax=Paremcibacter congregatus TaxID=2043170 RepID=A0A2G4YMG7_9PROT|nr:50S ribosomal protein L24 [Paremcibacter congregatus]PHZ83529.1 50S ribosomal protein L24 [Paremcibacter congregatus]QDE28385.1 50S ribosomal protein L24 [Paremcibacter congregatus]
MATAKFKIKKGDEVIVLTGKDKGKKGEIIRMIPSESRAVVKGINLVKRHTRQTQTEEGGIKTKEAPIHVSNLALIDPKSDKATKAGYKIEKDGTKVRISRASGEVI